MSTNSPSSPALETVDVWLDPACPWAWLTSRWLLEVEQVRAVRVRWHVMSLSVLNSGRDLPPDYQALIEQAWAPVRVLTAAAERYGEQIILPLYSAMGTRFHTQGLAQDEDALRKAIADVGLDEDLVSAGSTTAYDEALTASHQRAMTLVGDDVGTPVIAFGVDEGDPVAFFGPVVTPAPTGEAAGRLWDGVLLLALTDGFFELKRSRTRGPQVLDESLQDVAVAS